MKNNKQYIEYNIKQYNLKNVEGAKHVKKIVESKQNTPKKR
jgi:hypothetical protein